MENLMRATKPELRDRAMRLGANPQWSAAVTKAALIDFIDKHEKPRGIVRVVELDDLIHDAEIEAAPLDALERDCLLPAPLYAEGVLAALRELRELRQKEIVKSA